MKIVTYNIHYAIGRDQNYDMERVVDAVRDADIIALQEVERNYGPGEHRQPEDIADLLPHYYWIYEAAFDIDGSTKDAAGKVCNRRRQHGQMILSRWPILSRRYFPLPRHSIDHTFNMQLGVLEGYIDAPGAPLRVYAVHFGSEDSQERQEQAEFLRRLVIETPARGGAWTGPAETHPDRDWSGGLTLPAMSEDAIILGDFNMEPGTPEYRKLTSESPGIGHREFVDARTYETEPGGSFTWRQLPNRSAEPHKELRLDYCLVTAGLSAHIKASWVDKDAQGSDHQPVWLVLEDNILP